LRPEYVLPFPLFPEDEEEPQEPSLWGRIEAWFGGGSSEGDEGGDDDGDEAEEG